MTTTLPPSAQPEIGRARVRKEDARLITSVEDAWRTMALVEAAYGAAKAPGFPIPSP